MYQDRYPLAGFSFDHCMECLSYNLLGSWTVLEFEAHLVRIHVARWLALLTHWSAIMFGLGLIDSYKP